MHWRTCSQLGSSKNRLFWLFLRSHFWSSTTFCKAFFNVINVILHIVIYLTSVLKIFLELRIISGVIHKMSPNVANTALRLIMGNYIVSTIEIVFIYEIWVEYLSCKLCHWWLVFQVLPSGPGNCGHLYIDILWIYLHRDSPKNSGILREGIWIFNVNFMSFRYVLTFLWFS